jgi:hypothetical protein
MERGIVPAGMRAVEATDVSRRTVETTEDAPSARQPVVPILALPLRQAAPASARVLSPVEADLQRGVAEFCATGRRPASEVLPAIVAWLRGEVLTAITNRDYDEARRLKAVSGELARGPRLDAVQTDRTVKKQFLEERVNAMQQKLTDIREQCDRKLSDAEVERSARLEEMRVRHRQELDAFEEHWREPATLYPFSKPSAHLTQMQRDLQQCADAAAQSDLRRRVDSLKGTETAEAERKIVAAMRTALANLRKKQQQEESHLSMYWQRTMGVMQCEQTAEIEKAELCLRQLTMRREETKKRTAPSRAPAEPTANVKTKKRTVACHDFEPPVKLALRPIFLAYVKRDQRRREM